MKKENEKSKELWEALSASLTHRLNERFGPYSTSKYIDTFRVVACFINELLRELGIKDIRVKL